MQIKNEYVSRINKAIDFIENNIDKKLSLEKIASVANFSKFHFHRIFSSVAGETLNQFIQRIRLEKSAALLLANKSRSIIEIALDCGFSSHALFSRQFKEYFSLTPSQWREAKSNISKTNGKNSKTESNFGKELTISSHYISASQFNQQWRIKMKNLNAEVEVKEMPEMTVAYVRHIGPYAGDEKLFEGLFEKLMRWAGPRGLINFPETQLISIYHDDPEITDHMKLRTDICMTIPEDTKVDGEIGKMKLPGGKYAVAHFELGAEEFGEAWNAVMGGWLPESGYQCDDRLSFELYHNNYKDHPQMKHIVDICVPVKPL